MTDFLLENKSYPLKLKLQSGDLWCLPSRYTFFTNNKEFPMAFNPDNGTVRSEQEIKDLFNLPFLRDGRWARKNFLKLLDNKFSGDWIARETPTTRIDAMNSIIKKIEEIDINEIDIQELPF